MEQNQDTAPVMGPEEEPVTPAQEDVSAQEEAPAPEQAAEGAAVLTDQILEGTEKVDDPEVEIKAVLEAVVYITDEPLSIQQIAMALNKPVDLVEKLLAELVEAYSKPEHGVTIREVAGGYKMTTKAEHHEAVRSFVKGLKPPLKLSLAALETLAVIAYKQPITAPEVMEIRGVQGAGVVKTLLDRKLITTAGRKNVIGRPILYKTTKEFLVQFGLKDLSELPTLKEFEELRKLAMTDEDVEELAETPQQAPEVPAQQALEMEPSPAATPEPEPAATDEPLADEPAGGPKE